MMVFDLAFPFVKGGAQRRFYEVGRLLAARGWDVDWLTFQSWEGEGSVRREGITYRGLGRLPQLYGPNGNRNGSEPLRFAFEVLRRTGALRRYDVLWVGQWPVLHLVPLLAYALLTRRKVVIDWWEVWTYDTWRTYSRILGPIGFAITTALLRVAGFAGILVTDSRLEEKRLRRAAGSRARIHTIPNGIPRDEIGDLGDVAGPECDIVSLGRLKNHKRVDLLIEALRILKDEHRLMPKVAIVGDGPERGTLEAMVAAAGLVNVTFYGFVPDLKVMYRMVKGAKLCTVTTVKGGGGNLTLLEAYGCGLPVLAFRCEEGIDPELIDDGKSGLLISPPTARALADAIRSLLAVPDRLREMRQHVTVKASEYDWRMVGDAYQRLFASLGP